MIKSFSLQSIEQL